MGNRFTTAIGVCAALARLAGCGSRSSGTSDAPAPGSAATTAAVNSASSGAAVASTPAVPTSSDSAAAAGASSPAASVQSADYCRQRGGEVQTRSALWGTNGDPAGWLALAGSTSMCRFQADDAAKSRIYVDLTTLSSPQPTLAALAYLAKVPLPAATGGANPATGYCSKELGGSSTFGAIGASGGGWVARDDPDDVVVSLCVFPDLSFIDDWGLAYHSDGSIRGTDLATAMQYQPGVNLPPVYAVGAATPTS